MRTTNLRIPTARGPVRSGRPSPGGSLLSFKEAAAYLGRSERWLRRAVANRAIRHYKIGALLAFDPADLDVVILRGLREEITR